MTYDYILMNLEWEDETHTDVKKLQKMILLQGKSKNSYNIKGVKRQKQMPKENKMMSMYEKVSQKAAQDVLAGLEMELVYDAEWNEMYKVCYEYWSHPENRSLAERVAK